MCFRFIFSGLLARVVHAYEYIVPLVINDCIHVSGAALETAYCDRNLNIT